MEQTAGIRELKAELSHYLRQVKAGNTVVITEHGKPIGRIIPFSQPLDAQLDLLREMGLLAWSGERLATIEPAVPLASRPTVTELLLEDRE
jgi:prevent-host-death family protein